MDLGEKWFFAIRVEVKWKVLQFAVVHLVTEVHLYAGPGAEMGSTYFPWWSKTGCCWFETMVIYGEEITPCVSS